MVAAAPSLDLERRLLAGQQSGMLVAIDEVGRGALAGPLTIGAIAIDARCGEAPEGVRDSKALSEVRRLALVDPIRTWARGAVVVHVPATRIDEVGITAALGQAAAQAISIIRQAHTHEVSTAWTILLDGRHDFLTPIDDRWTVQTVVRGDTTCASIAAASIIAKCERDQLMREFHTRYPDYGWDSNVGYGTAVHRAAIAAHGLTPQHRASWNLR